MAFATLYVTGFTVFHDDIIVGNVVCVVDGVVVVAVVAVAVTFVM